MADTPNTIQGALDPNEPAYVYNHDVVSIRNRLNRFIMELIGSQSSGVSLTNAYDMARIESYLNAIDRFHDWVLSADQLDLPETKGQQYVLEPAPVVPAIENEDLADLVRLFVLTRRELSNSQSARVGSGLPIKQDSARLRAITDKARKFLKDYMTPIQPLDLPVSSPGDLATPNPDRGV